MTGIGGCNFLIHQPIRRMFLGKHETTESLRPPPTLSKTSILTTPSKNICLVTDTGNLADPRRYVYYISVSLSLKWWKTSESATRTLSFAFRLYCGMNARCTTQVFSSLLLALRGIILFQHPSKNICWSATQLDLCHSKLRPGPFSSFQTSLSGFSTPGSLSLLDCSPVAPYRSS